MKYFYFLFVAAFASLPFFANAQSNYKPGYVVKAKGDTVRGFINFKEWNQNPTYIEFKTTVSANKAQRLTTDDISFFTVSGFDSFQKFTGQIGLDPVDVNHISSGRDTTFKVASVFLRILAIGKNLTLFSYEDDIRTHFYIQEAQAYTPKELVYHVYNDENSQTGITKTVVDDGFRKQLFFLAQKYGMLTDDLELYLQRMGFYAEDMTKAVNKINGPGQAGNVKQTYLHKQSNFFAGVGANITTSVPAAGSYKPLGATNYTSVLPMVSAGVDILPSPNVGRSIFRGELSIADIHYVTNYTDKVYPYVPVTYKYSTVAIAFTPQFLYNIYNGDNFKFFGGVGLALTYYLYSGASYAEQNGTPVPNNSANYKDFVVFSTPIMIKTGVKINNRIEIYADYLTTTPVTNDEVIRLNFTSVQIGLNYYFK